MTRYTFKTLVDRGVTAEDVDTVIGYVPETGELYWKVTRPRIRPGSSCGCKSSQGYVKISVFGVVVKAHQIAWLLGHREWPDGDVDHINHDKADNRLSNLRLATRSQNCCNRGANSNNSSSGIKGVSLSPRGRWVARIGINYKRVHIGTFSTKEEAADAYARAAKTYHEEFAFVEQFP